MVVRVKITGSTSPDVWYAGLVGEIFEVYKAHFIDPSFSIFSPMQESPDRRTYVLKDDRDRGCRVHWRRISKDDCREYNDNQNL